MQVSKTLDKNCKLNRVNEKNKLKFKRDPFPVMFDGLSSFLIGLILIKIQTFFLKVSNVSDKNVDFIA